MLSSYSIQILHVHPAKIYMCRYNCYCLRCNICWSPCFLIMTRVISACATCMLVVCLQNTWILSACIPCTGNTQQTVSLCFPRAPRLHINYDYPKESDRHTPLFHGKQPWPPQISSAKDNQFLPPPLNAQCSLSVSPPHHQMMGSPLLK